MGFRLPNLLIANLFIGLFTMSVSAQEFVPPRPPPLDPATDFEDMEEDMMEVGDEGYRPPPPPPPPNAGNAPPDIRPPATGTAFGSGTTGKVQFKLVDGEYWQKGKKRGRGKKVR